VEAEPRKCIADYEKETREELYETKCILIDIYATITGKGTEIKQEDEPIPESMMENAQINKETALQIRGMAKTISMELFGK
jgi:hypothetical protein